MNFDRYWEDPDEYTDELRTSTHHSHQEMKEESALVKNRILDKFLKDMWRDYSEFLELKVNNKHDIEQYLGERLWLKSPEYPNLIRSILNVFDEYDEDIEKRLHDKFFYRYAKIIANKNDQIKLSLIHI